MALSHDRSHEVFQRSLRYLAGGVDSPVRAFRAVGGEPVVIARGEGPYVYDVDGNRYIDYLCSWGPLILGHAHPAVVEACSRAAAARHQLRRADGGRSGAGAGHRRGHAVD